MKNSTILIVFVVANPNFKVKFAIRVCKLGKTATEIQI